jgi:phosphoglycerate dehydrogenase-like enzyme
MSSKRVLVFNVAAHATRLAERVRGLPVAIDHVDFALPWQVIADRRAGRVGDAQPPSPALRALLAEAEVIFGFALPSGLNELAPRLRWVETPATGFDQLNGTGVLESGIPVTTVGGLYAPAVAEHAFALLFGIYHRLDEFRADQRRRHWELKEVRELRDATMAIVGLGNIGRAVARAAKAFGMRVVGTRRRVDDVPEGVDRVFPPGELRAMLGEADVVVVAVAGTAETTNLIGAPELAAMKPDACLINVARGIVVDEAALAAALRGGRLAAAGLDVFVAEPPPPDSPLWDMPNVLITPHVASNTPTKLTRAVDHFADNLRRYCAGEPLEDLVWGVRGLGDRSPNP